MTRKSGIRTGIKRRKVMARQNPCPVPGCQRNVLLTSPYKVCPHHTEQFEGITYFMQMAQKEMMQAQRKGQMKGVRPGERVTPSGIILP